MWLLLLAALGLANASQKFNIPNEQSEKGNEYWNALGKEDLDYALNRKAIDKTAKNVIIFVGDGMGVTVSTAGRIYKGQTRFQNSGEEGFLSWERFPNLGLSKTYNVDKQVPDSAATATAYFRGVKGNYFTVGLNGGVKLGDCKASLKPENRPVSVLKWAQDAGKDTGFVTTTRITHATPASLYAHSAHRYWECDRKIKESLNDTRGCKDIALQLIEDSPGRDANVIFAGGRNQMGAPLPTDSGSFCLRTDDRNLVEEWLAEKKSRKSSVHYVKTAQEFRNMDIENLDYVMGLFGGDHMPYHYLNKDVPSLTELTTAAIRRLRRSTEGYFLMVEAGRIDHALHDTKPHRALDELLELDDAVQATLDMINLEDTLLIVTADHSHVMTINGYPDRGNDILGTTYYDFVADGMEYTTLMFTNGIAANFSWDGNKVVRANVTGVNTRDFDFMPQAAVQMQEGAETHGGEDVAIYASGPMSHLFHRLHEQTYIAHVMGYASCIGPYRHKCRVPDAQPVSAGLSNGNRKELLFGSILASILLSRFYMNFLM